MWDKWGWHRVTFCGDLKGPVRGLRMQWAGRSSKRPSGKQRRASAEDLEAVRKKIHSSC